MATEKQIARKERRKLKQKQKRAEKKKEGNKNRPKRKRNRNNKSQNQPLKRDQTVSGHPGRSSIILSGRDRLGPITMPATITPSTLILYQMPISPSSLETSRLSAMAKCFEKFKFHQFKVTFVPTVANTIGGQITMYVDPNPDAVLVTGDTEAFNKDAMAHERSVITNITKRASVSLNTSAKNNTIDFFTDESVTEDDKWTKQGLFVVAASAAMSAAGVVLNDMVVGILYVDWKVEFKQPQRTAEVPDTFNLSSDVRQWEFWQPMTTALATTFNANLSANAVSSYANTYFDDANTLRSVANVVGLIGDNSTIIRQYNGCCLLATGSTVAFSNPYARTTALRGTPIQNLAGQTFIILDLYGTVVDTTLTTTNQCQQVPAICIRFTATSISVGTAGFTSSASATVKIAGGAAQAVAAWQYFKAAQQKVVSVTAELENKLQRMQRQLDVCLHQLGILPPEDDESLASDVDLFEE